MRLVLASALIPLLAWVVYTIARYTDGNPEIIDQNGSALGVLLIIASVFGVARIASEDGWSERAGVSLALSAAYFLLTWVRYGDPTVSVDDAPHLVWYGACVAGFTPSVVVTVVLDWAWSSLRARRTDFSVPPKANGQFES